MAREDLILIHAPSVYDFRKEFLFYGPVSDLVPSTPVFEMYPFGFMTIAAQLHKDGYRVRILNLASMMLNDRKLDAGSAPFETAGGRVRHRPPLAAARPRLVGDRGDPQETASRFKDPIWRLLLHLLSEGADPVSSGRPGDAGRLHRSPGQRAHGCASERPKPRKGAEPDLEGAGQGPREPDVLHAGGPRLSGDRLRLDHPVGHQASRPRGRQALQGLGPLPSDRRVHRPRMLPAMCRLRRIMLRDERLPAEEERQHSAVPRRSLRTSTTSRPT